MALRAARIPEINLKEDEKWCIKVQKNTTQTHKILKHRPNLVMNLWNMDTKSYEESFSQLEIGGAKYPSNFWSLKYGSAAEKGIKKTQTLLGIVTANGESGLLVLERKLVWNHRRI